MTEQTDDAVVKYGVKELLALQSETLKRIEAKVEQGNMSQAETNSKFDLRLAIVEALNIGPRLERLEKFRNAWPSLAVVATLISLAMLAIYIHTAMHGGALPIHTGHGTGGHV